MICIVLVDPSQNRSSNIAVTWWLASQAAPCAKQLRGDAVRRQGLGQRLDHGGSETFGSASFGNCMWNKTDFWIFCVPNHYKLSMTIQNETSKLDECQIGMKIAFWFTKLIKTHTSSARAIGTHLSRLSRVQGVPKLTMALASLSHGKQKLSGTAKSAGDGSKTYVFFWEWGKLTYRKMHVYVSICI